MPFHNGFFYQDQINTPAQPTIFDLFKQGIDAKRAREEVAMKTASEQRAAEMDKMKLQNMIEDQKNTREMHKNVGSLIDAYQSSQNAPDIQMPNLGAMAGGQIGGGVLGIPGMIPTTVPSPKMTLPDLQQGVAMQEVQGAKPGDAAKLLKDMMPSGMSPEDKMAQMKYLYDRKDQLAKNHDAARAIADDTRYDQATRARADQFAQQAKMEFMRNNDALQRLGVSNDYATGRMVLPDIDMGGGKMGVRLPQAQGGGVAPLLNQATPNYPGATPGIAPNRVVTPNMQTAGLDAVVKNADGSYSPAPQTNLPQTDSGPMDTVTVDPSKLGLKTDGLNPSDGTAVRGQGANPVTVTPASGTPPLAAPAVPTNAPGTQVQGPPKVTRGQETLDKLRLERSNWNNGGVVKAKQAAEQIYAKVQNNYDDIVRGWANGEPTATKELGLLWHTIQGLDNSVVKAEELRLFQSMDSIRNKIALAASHWGAGSPQVMALSKTVAKQMKELNEQSFESVQNAYNYEKHNREMSLAATFKGTGLVADGEDYLPENKEGFDARVDYSKPESFNATGTKPLLIPSPNASGPAKPAGVPAGAVWGNGEKDGKVTQGWYDEANKTFYGVDGKVLTHE